MKILIVNSIYKTPKWPATLGGAEKSVQFLAEGLAKSGHEVRVVAIADKHRATQTQERVNDVDVYSMSSRNIYWIMGEGKKKSVISRVLWHLIDDLFKAPVEFENIVSDFGPDIVYTNTLMGHTVDVWRIASDHNAKIVHTLRDYYLLCPKTTVFKNGTSCASHCFDCKLLTMRRRKATQLVDAVVGNSKFILDYHVKRGLFPSAGIKTNVGSISEVPKLGPRTRADNKVVFGYIGRFSQTKGIEQLLDSFKNMPENTKLLLAGDAKNEYGEILRSRSGPRVEFVGFVEPVELYSVVDVVVVPSLWHEPLPRAAIDAVSANRPVVGSNRGGTVEAMGEPPFGWVYDPDLPGSLDRALLDAYKMISNGQLPIQPHVRRVDSLRSYESIFEAVLDLPARARDNANMD